MKPSASEMNRRTFLWLATATGASIMCLPSTARAVGPARWSDPGTWNGVLPGPGDVVSITESVILDVDVAVAGVTVDPGGKLIFDPDADVTLTSTGNVIVRGVLRMRPSSPHHSHSLQFTGIDESLFQGGGMDVLDTDVGLWVMDDGTLDIKGSDKLALALANRGLAKDSNTIKLDRDPTGWRVGDEVAVAPSLHPGQRDFSTAYDVVRIRSIDRRTIRVAPALDYAHPMVTLPSGARRGAEILNLTRNVVIQGDPVGRTHVHIGATGPSSIAHALVRYVGPRKDGRKVTGRWGVHFHDMGDASRGSEVVGVVVRDTGSHAFVPHASHGVTFRNCIAHNVQEEPYWWDHTDETGTDNSDDVTWDRCVASLVATGDPEGHARLAGFRMEAGSGNSATGCVAIGVNGGQDASGFHWPEMPPPGKWKFKDCVGHNNSSHGLFVWQNDGANDHLFHRFVSYRNGVAGLVHGAYASHDRFISCATTENGVCGIMNHARTGDAADDARFIDVSARGGSLGGAGLYIVENLGVPAGPVRFVNLRLEDFDKPILIHTSEDPFTADLIRPTVVNGGKKRDLKPSDITIEVMTTGSLLRVQPRDGHAWQMKPNGSVSRIPRFA